MLIFHVVCFYSYFITTFKYIPVNILIVILACQARTANVPNPDKGEITTKRPSGKLRQISILMMVKYVYMNRLIFYYLKFLKQLELFYNVYHGCFYFKNNIPVPPPPPPNINGIRSRNTPEALYNSGTNVRTTHRTHDISVGQTGHRNKERVRYISS